MTQTYSVYGYTKKALSNQFRLLSKLCLFLLFLSLMNSTANAQIWQQEFTQLRECWGSIQTEDGGFIMLGRTGDAEITGEEDIIVLRTDIDGNELWTRIYGQPDAQDIPYDIEALDDGGFIISGHTVVNSADPFLLKIDGDGNEIWQQVYEKETSERGYSVIQTTDGGFAVTGCYGCHEDWEQTFLFKTDSDGNQLWYETYQAGTDGRDLIETSDGFAIAANIDLLQGDTSDVHIIKTDFDGNLSWDYSDHYGYVATAEAITVSPDGHLVFTGFVSESNESGTDIILTKLNNVTGEVIWSNIINSPQGDYGRDLVFTETGNIYISGSSWRNLNNNGDVLLIKTDADGNVLWDQLFGDDNEQQSFNIFPKNQDGFILSGVSRDPGQTSTYSNAFVLSIDTFGYVPTNTIYGHIFHDSIENCNLEDEETRLEDWLVIATSDDGEIYYGNSDVNGFYSIDVPIGSYDVELVLKNGYWEACNANFGINFITEFSSINFEYPLQTLYECAFLEVDISAPVLRPCQDHTYTINYCNHGPTDATDPTVIVKLDPFFTLIFSDLLFENDPIEQNTYIFNQLDPITVGDCGSFDIGVSLSCDVLIGQAHCIEALIYPDSICDPVNPAWDGSSIKVDGVCEDGMAKIAISNDGSNMQAAKDFIIIEDNVILSVGEIELPSGQDTLIQIEANGKTIRLEASQADGHPGISRPSVAMEGCRVNEDDAFSIGFLTQYPQDDGNPFISIDCQQNVSGIEPITMRAYPNGIGEEHLIENREDIEYHILFQNLTTETVKRVGIRDTLSQYIDLTSIRPGSSSHPYHFEMSVDGIISFEFDDINLVDAAISQDGSTGYVKFKASLLPGLDPGTVITNEACVMFDYDNPKSCSNQVFHTIEKLTNYHSYSSNECLAYEEGITEDTTLVINTIDMGEYDSVIWNTVYWILPSYNEEMMTLHQWEPFDEVYYTEDTTLQFIYNAFNGCDSIVDYDLDIIPLDELELDTTLCEGVPYEGIIYDEDAVTMDTLISNDGDSIIVTNIFIAPNEYNTIDTVLLSGEILFGVAYFEDSMLEMVFPASNGCDSIMIYNIEISTSVNDLEDIHFEVNPNPIVDQFNIKYHLNESVNLSIYLYNSFGQRILAHTENETKSSGLHEQHINLPDLPTGTYQLLIQTDKSQISKSLIKLK